MIYMIYMMHYLYSRTHNLETIIKYYKQLQIINTLFHNLCRQMVLPSVTFILSVLTSVSMYATIKLYHEVKMPAFIGFPLASSTTFLISKEAIPQSYQVYEMSRNLLITGKLQKVALTMYNSKVLKSCPPLKIYIGNYYFVNRSTFFVFMQIVIDNTIDAMLTF